MSFKGINIIVALFLAGFSAGSCQNISEMKGVKYGTSASCPTDYPINLHSGSFLSPEGKVVMIHERELNGPWGAGSVSYIVGNGFNPLPDKLKVGYFSDTEDEFFEGEFALPYEKIKQLFEEKAENPYYNGKKYRDEQSGLEMEHNKYNALNVGIALNGLVVVWASGERVQTEIGRYKAKVVNVKWTDVYESGTKQENKEENLKKIFTDKVRKEVLTNTLPIILWETYLKRYNWKYTIDPGQGGQKIEEVYFKMLNSEAISVYNDNPKINTDHYSERALPYNFDIKWTSAQGKKYGARIVFNTEETYYNNIYNSGGTKLLPDALEEIESYRIFSELDSSKPIAIIFRINDSNTGLNVFFKQGERELEAKKMNIKVFERSS